MPDAQWLTLQSRQQGHETHRAERLALDPRLTLGVTIELLASVRPDRRYQAAADTQLLEQRGRHGMRRRRQQDSVERGARRPTEVAVLMTEAHVANPQLAQGTARAPYQAGNALEGVDLLHQRRQHR